MSANLSTYTIARPAESNPTEPSTSFHKQILIFGLPKYLFSPLVSGYAPPVITQPSKLYSTVITMLTCDVYNSKL